MFLPLLLIILLQVVLGQHHSKSMNLLNKEDEQEPSSGSLPHSPGPSSLISGRVSRVLQPIWIHKVRVIWLVLGFQSSLIHVILLLFLLSYFSI